MCLLASMGRLPMPSQIGETLHSMFNGIPMEVIRHPAHAHAIAIV